jgi:hypothetical protein
MLRMPPRWLLSVLLIAGVVPVAWALMQPSRVVVCGGCRLYGREIEVRGRLVDGDGRPLGTRGVLALEHAAEASEAHHAFSMLSLERERAASGEAPIGRSWYGSALGGSSSEGRFLVRYVDTNCVCSGMEPQPEAPPWEDRDGLFGIAIERPGVAPFVLTPPPHGTWTKAPQGTERHGPAYVWDLGDIVVPDA